MYEEQNWGVRGHVIFLLLVQSSVDSTVCVVKEANTVANLANAKLKDYVCYGLGAGVNVPLATGSCPTIATTVLEGLSLVCRTDCRVL